MLPINMLDDGGEAGGKVARASAWRARATSRLSSGLPWSVWLSASSKAWWFIWLPSLADFLIEYSARGTTAILGDRCREFAGAATADRGGGRRGRMSYWMIAAQPCQTGRRKGSSGGAIGPAPMTATDCLKTC